MGITAIARRIVLAFLLATPLLANARAIISPSDWRDPVSQVQGALTNDGPEVHTDLAIYRNCTKDAIKAYEAFIPDQLEIAAQASYAMNLLTEHFDEPNLSGYAQTFARGAVNMGDLRELARKVFGNDAVRADQVVTYPKPSILKRRNSDTTLATPLKEQNELRLKNSKRILETFKKVENFIRDKPTINCESCEDLGGSLAAVIDTGINKKLVACPGTTPVEGTIHYFDEAKAGSVDLINGKPKWKNENQWLIHEAAHIEGIGEKAWKSVVADVEFIQPANGNLGVQTCGAYGISSVMWLAENNSYMAMRNAENFAMFAFGVEWLARGYGVPTAEEYKGTQWACHDFKPEDLQTVVDHRLGVIAPHVKGAQAAREEISKVNLFEDSAAYGHLI